MRAKPISRGWVEIDGGYRVPGVGRFLITSFGFSSTQLVHSSLNWLTSVVLRFEHKTVDLWLHTRTSSGVKSRTLSGCDGESPKRITAPVQIRRFPGRVHARGRRDW